MLAFDQVSLLRLLEYARELRRLHIEGSDQQIDREFNGACYAVWGFTLDDFDDEMLSAEDQAWLDDLTPELAEAFAVICGYDLRDYAHGGLVADWWGFLWMILAEKRGILTPFMASLAKPLPEKPRACEHNRKCYLPAISEGQQRRREMFDIAQTASTLFELSSKGL